MLHKPQVYDAVHTHVRTDALQAASVEAAAEDTLLPPPPLPLPPTPRSKFASAGVLLRPACSESAASPACKINPPKKQAAAFGKVWHVEKVTARAASRQYTSISGSIGTAGTQALLCAHHAPSRRL